MPFLFVHCIPPLAVCISRLLIASVEDTVAIVKSMFVCDSRVVVTAARRTPLLLNGSFCQC